MRMSTLEGKNEGRVERGTVFLTPEEKQALRVVAALRGVSESDVLRETPIAAVVAEFNDRVTIDPNSAVKAAA